MTATTMSYPVRCLGCGHVHDAGYVTVTARYADCSMWKCPGCGRTVDDRPGVGGIERIEHPVPLDGDDLALVGGQWVRDSSLGVMRWVAS